MPNGGDALDADVLLAYELRRKAPFGVGIEEELAGTATGSTTVGSDLSSEVSLVADNIAGSTVVADSDIDNSAVLYAAIAGQSIVNDAKNESDVRIAANTINGVGTVAPSELKSEIGLEGNSGGAATVNNSILAVQADIEIEGIIAGEGAAIAAIQVTKGFLGSTHGDSGIDPVALLATLVLNSTTTGISTADGDLEIEVPLLAQPVNTNTVVSDSDLNIEFPLLAQPTSGSTNVNDSDLGVEVILIGDSSGATIIDGDVSTGVPLYAVQIDGLSVVSELTLDAEVLLILDQITGSSNVPVAELFSDTILTLQPVGGNSSVDDVGLDVTIQLIGLSGDSATTADGGLETEASLLAQTIGGSSTISGDLDASVLITSQADGSSNVGDSAIEAIRGITGTIAGFSSVDNLDTVIEAIIRGATSDGSSTTNIDFGGVRALSGVSSGSSIANADTEITAIIRDATSAGTATADSDLIAEVPLTTQQIDGTSSSGGTTTVERTISSVSAGLTTIGPVNDFTVTTTIYGATSSGTSDTTGALETGNTLSGVSDGSSTADGSLNVPSTFVEGSSYGITTTNSPDIRLSRGIETFASGLAVVQGSLSADSQMIGGSAGTTIISGSIEEEFLGTSDGEATVDAELSIRKHGSITVTIETTLGAASSVNRTFRKQVGFHSIVGVSINYNASNTVVDTISKYTNNRGTATRQGVISLTKATGHTHVATYELQEAIAIDEFSPISGLAGTAITMEGEYFTDVMWAEVNGLDAAFSVTDDQNMTVTVPSGMPEDGNTTIVLHGGTLGDCVSNRATPFTIPIEGMSSVIRGAKSDVEVAVLIVF